MTTLIIRNSLIYCLLFGFASSAMASIVEDLAGVAFGTAVSSNTLRVWVDGTSITTTAGIPSTVGAFTAGGTIWRDKSGNGADFDTVSGTVTYSTIDGRTGVVFDRVHALKTASDAVLSGTHQEVDTYVVFRMLVNDPNLPNGNYSMGTTLFDLHGDQAGGQHKVAPAIAGSGQNQRRAYFAFNSDDTFTPTTDGVQTEALTPFGGSVLQFARFGASVASDTLTIADRGFELVTSTVSASGGINYTGSRVILGNSSDVVGWVDLGLQATIYEFMVFSRTLNAAENLLLSNYLGFKWRLPLFNSNLLIYDRSNGTGQPVSPFRHDLTGIAQVNGETREEISIGGLVLRNVASTNGFLQNDSDTLTIAHDNNSRSSSRTATISGIFANKNWYAYPRGTDGSVGSNDQIVLEFDLKEIGFNFISTPTMTGAYNLLIGTVAGDIDVQNYMVSSASSEYLPGDKVRFTIDADLLRDDAGSSTGTGKVFTLNVPLLVTMAASGNNLMEGDTETLTFALNVLSPSTVTVNLAVTAAGTTILRTGGVDNGQDYILPLDVQIGTGQANAQLPIHLIEDPFPEMQEMIVVDIASVSAGAAESGTQQEIFTFGDNDTAGSTISLSVNTISEEAGQSDIRIKLSAAPESNPVFYTVINHASTVVSLATTSVQIQRFFWESTAIITVTGVPNNSADPNPIAVLTLIPNTLDHFFQSLTQTTLMLTVTNDDSRGIDVDQTNVSVQERAGRSVINVSLSSQPSGSVDVAFMQPSTRDFVVEFTGAGQSQLTFTPSNWDVAQAVTLVGVDDREVHDIIYSGANALMLSTASVMDLQYQGLTTSVNVTVQNEDNPGFLRVPANLNITENTSTTMQVRLTARPRMGGVVVLNTVGMAASEVSVSLADVTFTHDNWNQFTTLTVTAVDDNFRRVDSGKVTLTVDPARTTDNGFDSMPSQETMVSIVDDDVAGITATPATFTVNENGGVGTFAVRLNVAVEASSPVQLAIVPQNGTANVSVSPLTLSLDDTNPANIMVTGVDDNFVYDDIERIFIGIVDGPTSYLNVSTRRVTVNLTNDDFGDFNISTNSVQIDENTERSIDVALTLSPGIGTVIVQVASDNEAEVTVAPRTLVFNAASYNFAQPVVLTAVDDIFLTDDTASITISINSTLTTANPYDTLAPRDVSVSIINTDVAQIDVTPLTLSVAEGSTAAYTLRSIAVPQATVTITVDNITGINFSGSDVNVSGGVATLTLSPDISAVGTRTIVVESVDDNLYTGDRQLMLTHSISSLDSNFAVAMIDTVQLTVTNDNDRPIIGIAADAMAVYPENATMTRYFNLTLSNPSTSVASARLRTAINNTVSSNDYNLQITSGTSLVEYQPASLTQVRIMPFQTSARIVVGAIDDIVYEGNENLVLEIIEESVQGANYLSTSAQASITIADNEGVPEINLSLAPEIIPETSATARIDITLSGGSSSLISVAMAFGVADNSSAESDDYRVLDLQEAPLTVNSSGHLLINIDAEQTTAAFLVQSVRDSESTDDERLSVSVFSIQGAATVAAGGATVSLVITEDTSPPTGRDNLQLSNITGGTVDVSWDLATDDRTSSNNLVYRVFISTSAFTFSPTYTVSERNDFLMAIESIQSFVVSNTNSLVIGDLLPLRIYYITVSVEDGAPNTGFYHASGISFSTTRAIDMDADGLADHLADADGDAVDSDGDGLSDDVERYLLSVPGAPGSITLINQATDINNNRIPDGVEVALGLPVDQASAREIIGEDVRPVVSVAPIEMTLVSAGLYTSAGFTATATDGITPLQVEAYLRKGSLCGQNTLPTHYAMVCAQPRIENGRLMLPSGENRLWWIAVDSDGNWPLHGAVTQTINIIPYINFSTDERIGEQRRLRIKAMLSGDRVDNNSTYAVTVHVTTDTTLSEIEIGQPLNLEFPQRSREGSLAITAGNREGMQIFAFYTTDTVIDSSGTTVNRYVKDPRNLQPGDENRVVIGEKTTLSVTVFRSGLIPTVRLMMFQSDQPVTSIAIGDIPDLLIRAIGNDPQQGANLNYDWSGTSLRLSPPSEVNVISILQPSAITLDAGSYPVSVRAINNRGDSIRTRTLLRVLPRPVSLGLTDTDRDGILDRDEGLFDNDMDGIPNYIDALTDNAFLLQGRRVAGALIPDAINYLLSSDFAVKFRLGMIALASSMPSTEENSYAAAVGLADIRNFGNDGAAETNPTQVAVNAPVESAGIYDFVVTDLPDVGGRVNIVLPMLSGLPPRPEYRKYRSGLSWQEFDSSNGDRVVSVAGQAGQCPSADAEVWNNANGLTAGHLCVRVSIADGGINDGDGLMNGEVANSAGVGSIPVSGVSAGSTEGGAKTGLIGGGKIGVMSVLGLLLLAWWRLRRSISILLALVAFLFASATAHSDSAVWEEWLPAHEKENSRWSNLYGGAGVGISRFAPNAFGTFRIADDSSRSIRYSLGFRFSPLWSLEAFHTNLGEGVITGKEGESVYDYSESGIGLSYRLPKPSWNWRKGSELEIDWHWQLFLGYARQNVNWTGGTLAEDNKNQAVFGVQWDLVTATHWFVRLAYEQYGSDASMVTVNWFLGKGR